MQNKEQEAIERFSQMALPRLRTYQSIVEKQIKLAFGLQKTDGLIRMQGMSRILAAAVDFQVFGISPDTEPELVAEQLDSSDFNDLII